MRKAYSLRITCQENSEFMIPREIVLNSLHDTQQFGIQLGSVASPGDVICLDGELGAGKTTLTQAIAKGLDVPSSCYVTSPSFSILHEYPGRIPLYHMDFYRLNDSSDIEDLGIEEYFYLPGLTVIEWSKKAKEVLPFERLDLFLRIEKDDKHSISCTYWTENWKERLQKLHIL